MLEVTESAEKELKRRICAAKGKRTFEVVFAGFG